MTPEDFIEKWRKSELKERSASQSHFNDLCALLGEQTPTDADQAGEWFCFEKGAKKTGGGDGWADVWKKGHFGWEYKGPNKDLDKAYQQLQRYAVALENPPLLVVSDTNKFDNWFKGLCDKVASARIKARLRRIELGNPGDIRPVGGGVSEIRIHYGPGYRVYLIERGIEVIVLLCGGDKSSQQKNIETAKRLALQMKENAHE